jgi:outer membrane receptor protein involved in Fe transport
MHHCGCQYVEDAQLPSVDTFSRCSEGPGTRKCLIASPFTSRFDIGNTLQRLFLSIGVFGVAVAVALILTFFPLSLSAQVGSADVLGTVTDPSGAVIFGAQVTVKNLGTAVERNATTNSKGEYIVNLLPIGSYSVTVEAPGFKVYATTGITLSTGDRVRCDAKLSTGAVSEKIEVTGETAALQTDSSTVSSTIETNSVQDLPLNNRNYFSVVDTLPGISVGAQGATTSKGSATSGNNSADRRPSSTVVANGQSDALNNNLINGFDNNEVINGIAGVRPTVDGIAEMNVNSTNAPAEYGRAAGAVVNLTTKSGTNSFHGSGFEYLRNEATDARNFYNTDVKAKYRQNNFGGSLGGPIRKDKTFFFFAYEQDPTNKGLTYTSKVPTDYEIENPGDFSDVSGVSLTADEINPLMLKMFKLYPKHNTKEADGVGYYTMSPDYTQRLKDWEVRVDQHFSPRDIFFARYANNPGNTFFPGAMPVVDGASPVGSGTTDPGKSITNAQNIQLDYVHIINSNLILDLKAGYTRYNSQSLGLNYGKGLAVAFDVPNAMSKGEIGDDLPMFGGPDLVWSALGGGATFRNISNSFQYGGSVTYNRGSHDFKFGAGFIRRQLSYAGNSNAAGRAIMGVALPPYGDQRADFLAGYPVLFFRTSPVYNTEFLSSEWSGYAQDNWRVTSKLTLNLGVRYDIFSAYREKFDHVANFNASTLSDGLALDAHNFYVGGSGGIDTDYGNVAPRVGFAYSLNSKTVVRGGFGMAYSPAATNNGGTESSSIVGNTNPPFYFSYTAHMPNLNDATVWKNPTASTLSEWNDASTVTTLSAQPTDTPSLRVFQTNLAMQREFGANTITAAFVGVHGRNLATSIDLNKPDMPGAGNATAKYVYTSTANTMLGSSTGILNYVTSIASEHYNGFTNYDAMQLIFSRHIGKDLILNSNWTWAHGLSTINGSNSDGAGTANNDQIEYGNSGSDIRHRVTVTVSYALPFGKSSSGFKSAFIKGWQLNDVFQWQTGTPYTITSGAACDDTLDARCVNANGESYTNQAGQTYYRPDIVGKPIVNGALNLEAFAPPEPGTQGNEGINTLYGPHFRNDDLSLFKTFRINDRFGLQFRAESFNVSNTPNFATPGATISAWKAGSITTANPSGLVAKSDGSLGVTTDTSGFSNPRNFQFALKLLF